MENQATSGLVSTQERFTTWIIAGLTVVVFAAVVLVLFGLGERAPQGAGRSTLPEINASLNGLSAILLVTGYVFIRKRKITAHKTCMLTAFALSSLFLITYLIHHYQVGSVPFQSQGWLRIIYFSLLIPHVALAAVVVPLALTTIHRGWKARFDEHVRIARWALPIWLFVSVSGVLVYVMLYHLGA